jgi:argininosuccinate lyase
MKLWGGRFEKTIDKAVFDFQSSITFDKRMYKQDILGSVAHVKTLLKSGILTETEASNIEKELLNLLGGIEAGLIPIDEDAEDIHSFVEKQLTEKLGATGKKVHTGRSRNDQVALDFRMYLGFEVREMGKLLGNLETTILTISKQHVETIMPGFTHLQKAQPITYAHHLMAYFQMFKRDIERLTDANKRIEIMPLGSGALGGTTYNLDRFYTAEVLGFENITSNSLDGVSDRDFAIELASDLSIIMMHLSRFCEEIIMWASGEYHFIDIDENYSTGSSIMPQKKNPDFAELIRGKTGRVYGSLITLLTVMKALPLAYNKDMQEDKEAVFDAVDTVKACLIIFEGMLKTIKVNKTAMYESAQGGFTNATDLADYLVKKGVPFRDAHEICGKLVRYSIIEGKTLTQLGLDELKDFSNLIEEDIYEEISLETCVKNRKLKGGPAASAVMESIDEGEKFLKAMVGGNLV